MSRNSSRSFARPASPSTDALPTVALQISRVRPDGDGEGWAQLPDGKRLQVRVAGALPGDQGRVVLQARSAHHPHAWGNWEDPYGPDTRVHAPVVVPCVHAGPLHGACGGCPWMHLPEAVRHDALQQLAASALAAVASRAQLPLPAVQPAPAAAKLGWRTRHNLQVWRDDAGQIQLGVRSRTGASLVTIDNCQAITPPLRQTCDALAAALRQDPTLADLPIFSATNAGLRWLSVREGDDGVLVDWVHSLPPQAAWPDDAADRPAALVRLVEHAAALPGVVGVTLTHNDHPGNAIRHREPHATIGNGSVTRSLAGVTHTLTPASFFQLHTGIAHQIVQTMLAWAPAAAHAWDLYAGVGTIGLAWAASTGGRVDAIESVADAARAGQQTAQAMGLAATFHTVPLAGAAAVAALADLPVAQLIVVDPPRAGLDPDVAAFLASQSPDALLYLSCDATTLARDVTVFLDAGWTLDKWEAWELLPLTGHIETLVRLRPG